MHVSNSPQGHMRTQCVSPQGHMRAQCVSPQGHMRAQCVSPQGHKRAQCVSPQGHKRAQCVSPRGHMRAQCVSPRGHGCTVLYLRGICVRSVSHLGGMGAQCFTSGACVHLLDCELSAYSGACMGANACMRNTCPGRNQPCTERAKSYKYLVDDPALCCVRGAYSY